MATGRTSTGSATQRTTNSSSHSAVRALADERLVGALAEFEEALRKRRRGAPKDLEDAVDEAAKSVESILKVLADARAELSTAEEHLRRLDEQTADLAGELHGLIAATHDAMHTHGNGDTS